MMDIENRRDLLDYLRGSGRIEATETPRIETLKGGVSNRTVLVQRVSGESWVLKQALEKLRVSVEWLSDPARIRQEVLALKWLPELIPPDCLTPLLFEDLEHNLFAMEAVPKPHQNWKELLLAGQVENRHITSFARILSQIHSHSYEQREVLSSVFSDDRYFESLRLEPYYLYTAGQIPAAATFLRDLVKANRQRKLTLVHGDFSPKNVLIQADRLILLDHEVIHFGDPAFDFGFAMTHLMSKGHFLTDNKKEFQKAALSFGRAYFPAVMSYPFSEELEKFCVFNCLGCLLARAAGRSPLEYLDACLEKKQIRVVLKILDEGPPHRFHDLVERFFALL